MIAWAGAADHLRAATEIVAKSSFDLVSDLAFRFPLAGRKVTAAAGCASMVVGRFGHLLSPPGGRPQASQTECKSADAPRRNRYPGVVGRSENRAKPPCTFLQFPKHRKSV